jgi:hypothetical protein
VLYLIALAVAFLAGLAVGRWWALVLPAALGIYVTFAIEGGDDVPPGWVWGIFLAAIGSAFVGAGVLIRKATREPGRKGVQLRLDRLSLAEAVAAAGGLFLLATTLFEWFEESPSCFLAKSARLDAWEAFGDVGGVILALAALVPIGHVVLRLTDRPAPPALELPAAGVVALVLIFVGTATSVGSEVRACPGGSRMIDTTPRFGLWFGIAFALVIAVSGWLVARPRLRITSEA